jgi:CxxC motif-containing protein (DUF1111 family)
MKPGRYLLPTTLTALAIAGAVAVSSEGPLPHRTDLTPEDRARVASILDAPVAFDRPQPFEGRPGGAATTFKRINRDIFSQSSANLDFEGEQNFKLGNALFRKLWVASPASTLASDGLGPLYNTPSCQRCHLKDGRGHPPDDGGAVSILLRLSVPARSPAEKQAIATHARLSINDPVYGGQLQDFGTTTVPAEGRVSVAYAGQPFTFPDGETVTLRKPVYSITDPGYGPLDPDLMISPRIAPQMPGLGLLEAVHEGDIRKLADPEDRDGDGISGRVSEVPDDKTGRIVVGRFGWKAEQPTVEQQTAHAFSGDLGLSTPLLPGNAGDCTPAQQACRAAPHGEQPDLGMGEAPAQVLDLVTFYSANLAVPARRNPSAPDVLAGKKLFHDSGCAACHRPGFVTSRDAVRPEHRFQLIWPYTDLLLHDMGEGLSDNRPMANAGAREWRTPPLWGIGLTGIVSGHTFFLHDGRARNLTEAILWHGGEAEAARNAFAALSAAERARLITFLESL